MLRKLLCCEAVCRLLRSERRKKRDLNSLWHSVRLTSLLPLTVRLCSLQKPGIEKEEEEEEEEERSKKRRKMVWENI